ncbi:MAG TPA: KamA family radical SAM protein [Chlamydiales bacterium]|nr:KamA family radical SAM protein [Chlamydiales bacterium]
MSIWRQIQRENFTSLSSLLKFLEIEEKSQFDTDPKFVLNLPKRLAEKIKKNTLNDPILRQFVPLIDEKVVAPGFVMDPVGDKTFCKTGKILQKYRGRALILTTSACAMHCRFCFRQNFPYETKATSFDEEIAFLKNDPTIEEVILSGGDPLSLSDQSLSNLFHRLDAIPHIQRIRFHTRFPIGIPERIDDSFLNILANSQKAIYFVIHCNHTLELDEDVIASLKKIQKLGIPVLSQSVLLKDVNDDEQTLFELFQKMVNCGIIPYYLHQLDLVIGAQHFMVSDQKATDLIHYLEQNLSGYAVPHLVREITGQKGKTRIY